MRTTEQPVWKRIAVIRAGPAVNIVIAFVILLLGCCFANGVVDATRAPGRQRRARATRPRACCSRATGSSPSTAAAATRRVCREQIAHAQLRGRARRRAAAPATPATLTIAARRAAGHRERCGRSTTPRRSACASASRFDRGAPRRRRRSRPPAASLTSMWCVTTATVDDDRAASSTPRSARRSPASSAPTRSRARPSSSTSTTALYVLGADLAVARHHQPLPVPAARRRAHLLGASPRRCAARPIPFSVMERAGFVGLRARDDAVRDRPDERHRATGRARASTLALMQLGRIAVIEFERMERRGRSAAPSSPPSRPATMAEAFRITVEDYADTRRRPHQGRRGLADLGRAARPRRRARRRPGQARRQAGDTVALMFSNRPEFHIADLAVMTLGATPFSLYATLVARADPVRGRGRRREGRAGRGGVTSSRSPRRASSACTSLETDRRARGRAGRRHGRLGRRRGLRSRLRRRAALARARPGRPADADLHVRHDRPAEGRPAHAPQPDGRGARRSRTSIQFPDGGAASSRGCRPRTSPSAPRTTTCRSSSR